MSGSSRSVWCQSFSSVRRLEAEKMPKNRNANFPSFRFGRFGIPFGSIDIASEGRWWTALVKRLLDRALEKMPLHHGDMNGIGTTSIVKITSGISSNSGADFSGNLEVCAGSYGTNSSNNITQNGALKNGAVAACDQAYIPTSSCNPEGNGTPTVSDADNDGVADENDLFPNDPLRAGESFYPGSNVYGTLAFEDLWPAQGDYDFNDVVVDYQLRMITNANNDVVDIEISYALRAIGGSFKNGFGLELNVPAAAVASVSRSNTLGQLISLNANGTEASQSKAVIILFDNAFNVLVNNGTATVNTIVGATPSQVDTAMVSLTFTTAKTMAELGAAPFNPFIFIDQDRLVGNDGFLGSA